MAQHLSLSPPSVDENDGPMDPSEASTLPIPRRWWEGTILATNPTGNPQGPGLVDGTAFQGSICQGDIRWKMIETLDPDF